MTDSTISTSPRVLAWGLTTVACLLSVLTAALAFCMLYPVR